MLFFGLTTVDICNYVETYPASNGKVRAQEQLVFAGGPAANAAVACRAAGREVTLVTGLGDHPLAQLARRDLAEHGVRVVDWAAEDQGLPVLSSITIEASRGDRCVVYTDTSGRTLAPGKDIAELLAGVSLIMFDGYYLDQAADIAVAAFHAGIPTVLDGGSWKNGLERLLSLIRYGICSSDFYPPGCATREQVMRYLVDCGVHCRAVSRGAGSLCYAYPEGNGEIVVPRREVADTLGAGDILHGAFCAALPDRGFVGALEEAVTTASDSCMYRGTRAWIKHIGKKS